MLALALLVGLVASLAVVPSAFGHSHGPLTFSTAGGIKVKGKVHSCRPGQSETTMSLTGWSRNHLTTVRLRAVNGKGSVIVYGAVEFEGTITSISVGDDGNVRVRGKGSLSDPGAAPTRFTLVAYCT